MKLYAPLSVIGKTPDYISALPLITESMCSDGGVFAAVGNPVSSLIYRGVWDNRSQQGYWHWIMHG
jgi:hypothetical protein